MSLIASARRQAPGVVPLPSSPSLRDVVDGLQHAGVLLSLGSSSTLQSTLRERRNASADCAGPALPIPRSGT